MKRLLVINPGSTSSQVSVFEDEQEKLNEIIEVSNDVLEKINNILELDKYFFNAIGDFLKKNDLDFKDIDAYIGRGAPLRPVSSGTYIINEKMIEDIKSGEFIEHASQLGALIGWLIKEKYNIPIFIVDPVSVDEMDPIARISGLPECERKSLSHALNIKACSKKYAKEINRSYEDLNLIVAHMGGGISITAHKNGRMIDVLDANGEGPFSPERTGGLRVDSLVKLAYSGKYTLQEMKKVLTKKGGLVAYLGTNNGLEIKNRIENGDEYAKLIFEAMAYQISKGIAEMAVALSGKVDAIILTGGLARSEYIVNWIKERVSFITDNFKIYPGSNEMEALALGGLRVLRKEEKAKNYPDGNFIDL